MPQPYIEKRERQQDKFDLREYSDQLSKNFRELIICARCLGRYFNHGYSDSGIDFPTYLIPGEQAAATSLIDYFLESGCFLQTTVGDRSLVREDDRGIFRSGETVLIAEQRNHDEMPVVGNPSTGFISIEEFCNNLYFDGVVQLIRTGESSSGL